MHTEDKELIELAAKAIGINVVSKLMPVFGSNNETLEFFQLFDDGKVGTWNPLKDSGDALQLVVNLHLIVGVYDSYTSVCLTNSADRLFTAEESLCWNSETNGDPYAATRKAITRAAAEIGRNMK